MQVMLIRTHADASGLVHVHIVFVFFFQTLVGPVLLRSVVCVDVGSAAVALHIGTQTLWGVVDRLAGKIGVLWYT